MTALVAGYRSPIEEEAFTTALHLGVPFSLQLSVTARCNLRCAHCYSIAQDDDELTTAEVTDLLKQAAAAGTFMLVVTGGEPLCRRDLPALLERALDLRFATKLYTNGTLVDDGAADLIADNGVHQVHVSVFSADAAVHDRITGRSGSLAAALAGVERLRRRGVKVMLKCVIMKPNLATFPSVLHLAEELGASCAFDAVVTVRNDGDTAALALRLGHDDLVRAFATPEMAAAVGDETVPGESAVTGELAGAPPCAAGFSNAAVWPNGDVSPCVGYPVVAGNVRRESFAEIWEHSPVLARIRATRIGDLDVCASCADVRQCGRCPGSALLEDGNIGGPSRAACRVAAARREAAEREVRS